MDSTSVINWILSAFATIGIMATLLGLLWLGYILWQIAKGLGDSAKILTALLSVTAELKTQNDLLREMSVNIRGIEYSLDKLLVLQFGDEEEQVEDSKAENE